MKAYDESGVLEASAESRQQETVPAHPIECDNDELYRRAVAVVRQENYASTSRVQHRLQIGYNRAADLIDRMEFEGVISPANHVGKRTIMLASPVADATGGKG